MKTKRVWIVGAGAAIALGVVPVSGQADSTTVVRYGVVEARQPVVLSGGVFGLSKKAGFAYTIDLQQAAGRIDVKSANTSFLVGDCLAVEGEGKKTALTRAKPSFCGRKASASASEFLAPPVGTDRSRLACQHAREESSAWPPGRGRHRALLREVLLCGDPSDGSPILTGYSGDHPCAHAWAEVEALPFGPARWAARKRARAACAPTP